MAARKKVHAKYLPEVRRNEELDELVVCGYACKVFRDDERASYIEQGRHLIPWMGQDDITIDRYDGRGHLFDIEPYDANKLTDSQLSVEEHRLEALCDEERYLELHTDLMERAIYEEEELKRLNEAVNDGYQATAFNYNYENSYDPSEPTEEPLQDDEEDEDDIFEAPESLKIPPDMVVPPSMKINAIIEKTALFVSQNGAQMEIVLKTKQSNNPQFDFLYIGNALFPYYKHMVQMMKSGRYIPLPKKPPRKHSHNDSDEDDEHSHSGYLHPSLAPKTTQAPMVLPQLKGSQIEGTAYAKLLNNIGKHSRHHSPNHVQQSAPLQHGYGHPVQSYMTHEAGYAHPSSLPPPPGVEPVTLPTQPPPPGTVAPQLPVTQTRHDLGVPTIGPQVIPPPPDQKPIIDRMAGYVIKEGLEFEAQVKSQDDPRFEFLKPWHVHNAYYEQKKKNLAQEILNLLQDENSKIAPKAVSFSIKAKEAEASSLEKKKKAFPFHESSEDEEDGGQMKPITDELDSVMFDNRPPPDREDIEKRMAEERLKDKLAAAAREKLAQASKEKQLQAERKRKAAMFLHMIKSTGELKEDEPGFEKSHSRTHSPSYSPYSSPSQHKRSSSQTHSWSRSPSKLRRSRSPHHRQRRRSRSPRRERSDRGDSKSIRRKRSPSPKATKRKTPPKAFSVARRSRSKSPPKRRKRRNSSSSQSDSSSRKKSSRIIKSRSKSSRSTNRSRRSRSRTRRSRSKNRSSKSTSSRSRRRSRSSSSSSSSSSDNELIKSPSPTALARLGATKTASGLVKALLIEESSERSTEQNSSSQDVRSTDLPTDDSMVSSVKDDDLSSQPAEDADSKQVSNDMLSKVRAMLKASRKVAQDTDVTDS